jgi:hypothetical protein
MGVPKTCGAPVDPRLDGIGVEIEPGCPSREALANAVPRTLDGVRVNVVEDDLPAGLKGDLGDAGAHDARPDDPDDRHTDFSASNGCRQPRQ